MQEAITRALLALVPGARWPSTRVRIEHSYTQLDVQSVDSWSGSVDGLAARIADALGTEGDTPALAGAAPTPSVRAIRTAVLVALARALCDDATTDDVLNGLNELGEAVAAEAPERAVAAWADTIAHTAGLDAVALPDSASGRVYRAQRGALGLGLYFTEAAARQHCEDELSNQYSADVALTFDWIGEEDPDDPGDPSELVFQIDAGHERTTAYTVVPLTVAAAYDPDAEQ
ncbi:hypothetical protein [Streptomyces sp. NPDC060198]|uniref:hypothetical protein n=1 Tax=Streptomyces sp. NPDC060198 TaxID=3347070 RepID=UPI003668B393